jgi:hypothetical protein
LVNFLLNKASDERVGGGPSFLDERGVVPSSILTHFEQWTNVEHSLVELPFSGKPSFGRIHYCKLKPLVEPVW